MEILNLLNLFRNITLCHFLSVYIVMVLINTVEYRYHICFFMH